MTLTKLRFKLGQVVSTRGVNDLIAEDQKFARFVLDSLSRHTLGDWGNLSEGDRQENERALLEGSRLFSAFKADGVPKIWIITEADRSATTILFPDEY